MKKITLMIPDNMRLGQAIMNAYREQWLGDDEHKYWDIWEQDTDQIQEKINKLN